MPKQVLRYQVPTDGTVQAVEMAEGAIFMDAQPSREGGINLWAIVDTAAAEVVRKLILAPTGQDLPEVDLRPIKTFTTPSGALHLLEVVA